MSLSRFALPWGLHVGAGVHVRLTESLNASCNFHLELSGSRAKPTAVHPGSLNLQTMPVIKTGIVVSGIGISGGIVYGYAVRP